MAAKPRVFIGSSSEHKPLAEQLCKSLDSKATPIKWWDAPEFQNGYSSLDALLKATESYDFAAFLLTADDECTSRKETSRIPRDNVIFEYGLFLGRLRQGRVLGFVQQGTKLPTDVAGIQMERFEEPKDEYEQIALAGRLAGITGSAIDGIPDWWNLHLGDVVAGWSIDPANAAFTVSLSKQSLSVRPSTFMDRQLVLVIRRQDDITGPMNDANIVLSKPRRYSALDERIQLVAISPSIIGEAPEGMIVEGRVFVVQDGFNTATSIEDVVAQGGRLVAGVTRSVRRENAK